MSKLPLIIISAFVFVAAITAYRLVPGTKRGESGQVAPVEVGNMGFRNMAEQDLRSRMTADEDLLLLDVREPGEYREGHIKGSILIPLGTLPNRLSELDKNREIVVVCRSGARSARGADILVKAGFGKVFSMSGGMMSWKGPVETGDFKPSK